MLSFPDFTVPFIYLFFLLFFWSLFLLKSNYWLIANKILIQQSIFSSPAPGKIVRDKSPSWKTWHLSSALPIFQKGSKCISQVPGALLPPQYLDGGYSSQHVTQACPSKSSAFFLLFLKPCLCGLFRQPCLESMGHGFQIKLHSSTLRPMSRPLLSTCGIRGMHHDIRRRGRVPAIQESPQEMTNCNEVGHNYIRKHRGALI